MFITKQHCRAARCCKGMGVTMALPFLEAMVPARGRSAQAARARSASPPSRWCTAPPAAPRSASRRTCGRRPPSGARSTCRRAASARSSPSATTSPSSATPTCATPRRSPRRRSAATTSARARCSSRRCIPRQTQGSDVLVGTSLDQLYAQSFGQDTAIPVDAAVHRERRSGRRLLLRLLVRLHRLDQLGGARPSRCRWCATRAPCSTCCSASAPRRRAPRAPRRGQEHPRLDLGDAVAPEQELGAADRARLADYLEDVREIERRIQRVEAQNSSGEPRELPGAPIGVPDSFEEHVKLMFDLQALAFASDTTRVFAFKLGRDASNRVYPESGVKAAFHSASHHQGPRRSHHRVREDQQLPRQHAAVFPRQAEEHAGRRRQPARQHAGHLRLADGQLERAQPQALPAVPRRPRRRRSRAACTSRPPTARRWPT